MREFFENPMWAIVTGVAVIAICITVYELRVDPRVSIMSNCVHPTMSDVERTACASAVSKFEVSK